MHQRKIVTYSQPKSMPPKLERGGFLSAALYGWLVALQHRLTKLDIALELAITRKKLF